MRQLLSTIAIGCVAVGLVGCSNTDWLGHSNSGQKIANNTVMLPEKSTLRNAGSKGAPSTTGMSTQSGTPVTSMNNTPANPAAATNATTATSGDRTQFESKRISNNFATNMEATDKAQLREAFENNPVGQASSWKNDKTGVTYQVTPTKNVTYKGNEYCREYTITDSKNGQKQGVACRSSKGAVWQPAS